MVPAIYFGRVPMAEKALSAELVEIIESMPVHPTSGDLLGALVRAERAGFERGQRGEAREEFASGHDAATCPACIPTFLRRQAE